MKPFNELASLNTNTTLNQFKRKIERDKEIKIYFKKEITQQKKGMIFIKNNVG